MPGEHKTISHDQIHALGYSQATDPGAVGAYRGWLDTGGGSGYWKFKIRNAADSGWEVLGVFPASGDGWRVKDGNIQLWNPDQSLYHAIQVNGTAGNEVIVIAAGEA